MWVGRLESTGKSLTEGLADLKLLKDEGRNTHILAGRMVGHARQVSSMGKGRNTHDVMVESGYTAVPSGEKT